MINYSTQMINQFNTHTFGRTANSAKSSGSRDLKIFGEDGQPELISRQIKQDPKRTYWRYTMQTNTHLE